MQRVINRLKSSIKVKRLFRFLIISLLVLYCFSIPSFGSREKFNYIVYLIMIAFAISVVVYSVLFTKPTLTKWFFPIPAFVLLALIGTLLYSKEYRSYVTLLLLSISFFILYFGLSIINNKKETIAIFSIALFAFSVYYIYIYRGQLFNVDNYISGDLRLGSYFDNPNGVSAFATVGYMLSFYGLLFVNKHYKWLFLFPIFSLLIVGISTGSRTFIVAFIVITIVISFFRFRNHIFLFFFVFVLFVAFLIIIFELPFMATFRERFIRIFWTFFTDSIRVDTSSLERIVWFDYGFFIGNKHLLTGTGPYGFGIMSGIGTYSHSNYSEVWCDFGIIGFLLFYCPMIMCVLICFIKKNYNKSLVLSISIYYFLVSFSNVFYYNKFYYFNLAFIFYLTFSDNTGKAYIHIESFQDVVNKIVITCDGMESGGAEKVISLLANQFAYLNYSVTIIGVSTLNKESFYQLDSRVNYITLHKNHGKRINSLKRLILLRKTFKNIDPDIILSFLPHINVYTYYASLYLGIPVVVSERNNPKKDPKNIFIRFFKNISFNYADGIVFQTNESRWYYKKRIRDKSVVIHNPIDPKLFNIRSDKSKRKIILSVGRLTEQKNFKCLIDAFVIFSKKYNDYILRIYGEGHLHEKLMAYAKSRGVEDRFEIKEKDLNWQIKEKDDSMFVLTSDYEGMPNALLEAMAIGIPSISTDCPSGGPREVITNGKNGYLAFVNDPINISDRMKEVIENPILYDVGEFASQFTTEKITNDWISFLKNVMEDYLSR